MQRGFGQAMMKKSSYRDSVETDVKFTKTGQEIKTSISKKVGELRNKNEKAQSEIAEICQRRDVKLEDLLQDLQKNNDVSETLTSYSNKMAAGIVVRSALEALQADLNKIGELYVDIQSSKYHIDELERVERNLSSERVFDLSYQELVTFGF